MTPLDPAGGDNAVEHASTSVHARKRALTADLTMPHRTLSLALRGNGGIVSSIRKSEGE